MQFKNPTATKVIELEVFSGNKFTKESHFLCSIQSVSDRVFEFTLESTGMPDLMSKVKTIIVFYGGESKMATNDISEFADLGWEFFPNG